MHRIALPCAGAPAIINKSNKNNKPRSRARTTVIAHFTFADSRRVEREGRVDWYIYKREVRGVVVQIQSTIPSLSTQVYRPIRSQHTHHSPTHKDSSSRFLETAPPLYSEPVIHFICTLISSRLLTTLTAVASTVPLLL